MNKDSNRSYKMKPNEVFGMLKIIEVKPYQKCVAICECGVVKEYLNGNIRSGKSRSCGCANRKSASERFKSYNSNRECKNIPKDFTGLNLSNHGLYVVWHGMIERCYNEKSISYKTYGAAGVRVCEDWKHSFVSFYEWGLKNGYEDGLQLDKDYKGDGKLYAPEFCQFVTRSINCRKRKTSSYYEYNGETKTVVEWCEIFNYPSSSFHDRIRQGWSVEKIFTTPINRKK